MLYGVSEGQEDSCQNGVGVSVENYRGHVSKGSLPLIEEKSKGLILQTHKVFGHVPILPTLSFKKGVSRIDKGVSEGVGVYDLGLGRKDSGLIFFGMYSIGGGNVGMSVKPSGGDVL